MQFYTCKCKWKCHRVVDTTALRKIPIPHASESWLAQLYPQFGVFVQFYDYAFNSGKGRKAGEEGQGKGRRGIEKEREKGPNLGASKGIWLAVIAVEVTAPLAESVVNGYSLERLQWHPLKSEFLQNRGRYHKMVLVHHRGMSELPPNPPTFNLSPSRHVCLLSSHYFCMIVIIHV